MESCDGAGGGVRGIAGRVEDELDAGSETDGCARGGSLSVDSREALGRMVEVDGG